MKKSFLFCMLIILGCLLEASMISAQEIINEEAIQKQQTFLEENDIDIRDVVDIIYDEIDQPLSLLALEGSKDVFQMQVPITFVFRDGSQKVVQDSVTYTLEYQEDSLIDGSQRLTQGAMAPSAIVSAYCEATYSSNWYGTAKSRTNIERDTVAQKVRTYSQWISLTQTAYWPWQGQGGLYYMTPSGSYGSWVSTITINHNASWKLLIYPNSWVTKNLKYEMSWAACVVLS